MGVFGDIWGGVKKVGHGIGKVADNKYVQGATAAALMASGVGAPAAAAIMAAQRGGGKLLSPGGNIGDGLRGALEGAAMGAGAAKAGAVARGAGSLASKVGSVGGALKGAVSGGGMPGIPSLTGGPSGGGGMDWKTGLLAAAQTANAAQLGAKSNEFADKAWNLRNDSYTARAPLRASGMARLMAPQTRDMSSLSAIRGQNPVAARSGVLRSAMGGGV